MRGSQRPSTPNKRSLVVRVDKALYEQALEWSLAEGVPIRAVVDAVLWNWFTNGHHSPPLRSAVLESAKAIAESIRTKGRAAAMERLPRWSRRRGPAPPGLRMPPPLAAGAATAASG